MHPPVFNVVVMQKFIILCIIRISSFTASVTSWRSTHVLQSGWLCGTTEQWSVYLIALALPVRIPTRSYAAVWWNLIPQVGLLWRVCRGRLSRRQSTQLSAGLSRRPVTATVTATIAPCAKTHRKGAAGREFDGILEANNETSFFGDIRKIDWRRYRGQKCCSVGTVLHFRAGTSAGWILGKVILCIIRTPNFTVRFLENKCVPYYIRDFTVIVVCSCIYVLS